jgi:hypothetical protein
MERWPARTRAPPEPMTHGTVLPGQIAPAEAKGGEGGAVLDAPRLDRDSGPPSGCGRGEDRRAGKAIPSSAKPSADAPRENARLCRGVERPSRRAHARWGEKGAPCAGLDAPGLRLNAWSRCSCTGRRKAPETLN